MVEQVYYIAKCKALIEKKLGWGTIEKWQNQDFATLSEKIFEETNVMLSASTLKRIWGKVRYESSPNIATLNALSRFAGYENWRAFTSQDFEDPGAGIEKTTKSTFKRPYIRIIFAFGLFFLLIFIGFGLTKIHVKQLSFENVRFTSKPVTLGLPNTVVFQYDATNSNADSVFIQQSWDSGKRYKVNKQLHEYTSTYYYPGYYRAKLILDDSVVKEHDVFIETDGWVGIIEKNPVPVYLPENLFEKQLMLTKEKLSELHIDFQKEAPIFSLTKVDKDINLWSDHFLLQVQLQNTYKENNAICQYTNVLIFGTEGVIDIPLCKIGCVGEVGLMLGMQYIDGKTNDLSGFGVDFSKEVILNCETKNQIIELSVNGKVVYTGDFKQHIGRIVGTQIKFNGTGVVRQFRLMENK